MVQPKEDEEEAEKASEGWMHDTGMNLNHQHNSRPARRQAARCSGGGAAGGQAPAPGRRVRR